MFRLCALCIQVHVVRAKKKKSNKREQYNAPRAAATSKQKQKAKKLLIKYPVVLCISLYCIHQLPLFKKLVT